MSIERPVPSAAPKSAVRPARVLVRCSVILIDVDGPMGRATMRHPSIHPEIEAGRLASWGLVRDLGDEVIVRICGTPAQLAAALERWRSVTP